QQASRRPPALRACPGPAASRPGASRGSRAKAASCAASPSAPDRPRRGQLAGRVRLELVTAVEGPAPCCAGHSSLQDSAPTSQIPNNARCMTYNPVFDQEAFPVAAPRLISSPTVRRAVLFMAAAIVMGLVVVFGGFEHS